MSDYPQATVRRDEKTGELVLDDPAASAMFAVIEQYNRGGAYKALGTLYADQRERVDHFLKRLSDLGHDPQEFVVVLIMQEDRVGAPLLEKLMPGHDWAAYRARGETPIGRGLAGREGIVEVLEATYPEVATCLVAKKGAAVVTVGYGYARIFGTPTEENLPPIQETR